MFPVGVGTGAGNLRARNFIFDAVTYLEENGLLIDRGQNGNDPEKTREINELFEKLINRMVMCIAKDVNSLYLASSKTKMMQITDKHILSVLPTQSSIPATTKRRIERIPKQLEIAKLERLHNSNFSIAINRYSIDSYLRDFSEGFLFYDRVLK